LDADVAAALKRIRKGFDDECFIVVCWPITTGSLVLKI
jgi:hypothetical protein